MHPLKQYLLEVDESVQEFANRVGACRQTLYRIIGGRQAPKPSLARRIVEATGAAVTFEALYLADEDSNRSGEIIDFQGSLETPRLDPERLKQALAAVISHLTSLDANAPPVEAVEITAEAVANTYAALSVITTRQGPRRLEQALRPVLEEILREYGASVPRAALDRGAALASEIYHQTSRLADRR